MRLMSLARPRRAAAAAAVLAVGLTAVLLPPADAATPASGTVSDTSPSVRYTAGPFVAPNVTGTAGAVNCTAPQSCDDYALTVATPAGYGTTHSLKVTVSWPTAAADFDVYLLDSAGR